jgi:glyoxylase-like metal-dependent hydrolase (beta-lactamase superfamily II)
MQVRLRPRVSMLEKDLRSTVPWRPEMVQRLFVSLVLCLLGTAWGSAGGPSTLDSGNPRESPLYQNFVRASEVLDRAIAAHGGVGLVDRTLDFRLALEGTLINQGHFARPWAVLDYPIEGTQVYSAELLASKSELIQHESGRQFRSFTIVGPANGLELRTGRSRADTIPAKELETRLREELEILPHEYLRQARAAAASLRLLTGAEGWDVLSYSLDEEESRALYLDARTHRLMRVERIGHWKHKGDRLEWRTFADYAERDGIQVPLRTEVHVEGSSYQYNFRCEITQAEFGAPVGVHELSVPDSFRAGFEGWTIERPKREDPNALLPFHDLGKGVYIIELSLSRSLLVAFSDFSVVVEAGDYSEISTRLLATAAHLLPDKPVRYVAMTHHHPLYACGLRPYVQRGITILATPGDVDYYRDLTTRPYRIHPDAQQREPGEPKFEVVDKVRIIKDKTQRLELHPFDYSTHVDEFVLPYLPSHKLIVTGDLVYVVREEAPRPASSRALAVHRVVKERNLDVRSIMQTWFLDRADHVVPYSALEERVRLAEAAKSAKQ